MRRLMAGILAAALGAGACGSPPSRQTAQDIEKAVGDVQKGAETAAARGVESVAKGLEDLAKGLGSIAGGDPKAPRVEPLTIEALKAALPALPDWKTGRATGERMMSPVNYAEAKVTLSKGDSTVDVKIVDSALNQILIAPFTMFLAVGYEKETDRGYERGVKVGEHPGWEKWDGERGNGELNAIVAKRFIVQIEGRRIEDMKVLHAAMDATNLKRLAAAK